ncbi:type IV pilus biogenesis protein PilM [Anaerobacillus sp. MEB173]|uniref:type IV pilus biogenesis protein PilM n=1 Tax=Anaerobacillus sp. MEB173 TaxID=3383345 RepID=UPI003F8FF46B
MSLFSFKPNKKIVSLALNDYVIRMVENHTHTIAGVKRWKEKRLPDGVIVNGKIVDDAALVQFLKECVIEWGIKKRPILFYVPDSTVIMRKVEIPTNIPEEEINGHFMLELGTSLHLPFQNPILDVYPFPLEEGKRTRAGVLFAAPEDEVLKYSDVLEEAKLEPVAADISALGLYRYFYESDLAMRGQNYLFAQFDIHTVSISIFSNHCPEFLRFEALTTEDNDHWTSQQTIEGELRWKYNGDMETMWGQIHDQHLEIERMLNFYKFSMHQGNKEVNQVIITGDHPYLEDIQQRLDGIIGIPVSILPKHDDLHVSRPFIPVVGLSLKEVN